MKLKVGDVILINGEVLKVVEAGDYRSLLFAAPAVKLLTLQKFQFANRTTEITKESLKYRGKILRRG